MRLCPADSFLNGMQLVKNVFERQRTPFVFRGHGHLQKNPFEAVVPLDLKMLKIKLVKHIKHRAGKDDPPAVHQKPFSCSELLLNHCTLIYLFSAFLRNLFLFDKPTIIVFLLTTRCLKTASIICSFDNGSPALRITSVIISATTTF